MGAYPRQRKYVEKVEKSSSELAKDDIQAARKKGGHENPIAMSYCDYSELLALFPTYSSEGGTVKPCQMLYWSGWQQENPVRGPMCQGPNSHEV
ncbi:hypothetical protein Mapa_006852 [Marchantia paleacea]|nr:hypothetical protein Mapa_006852 [Marchantia paleacea]